MNQVVNFLSLLAVTEEQGGIKRMLSVCTEFERIARVVLERGDKKGHKRRGSKMNTANQTTNDKGLNPHSQQQEQQRQEPQVEEPHGQKRAGSQLTPQSNDNVASPPNIFSSSAFNDNTNGQSFNPSLSGFSPSLSDMTLPLDFSSATGGTDFQNMMVPSPIGIENANFDPPQFPSENNSADSLNVGSFQQPFVPQDLWQMPMTLEWDWSEAIQGPIGLDAGAMDMSIGMAPGQSQEGQEQMDGGGGLVQDQRALDGGGRVMM